MHIHENPDINNKKKLPHINRASTTPVILFLQFIHKIFRIETKNIEEIQT